ncbi:MAG TPA: nuclear transport factor 2 family protein [Gammaproteobacteria bacterium]|nr:nuclear transport factor 2 family protein [Gammaproteobacteria bacterium]
MSTKPVSTRRSFFWKAGAALSAPLAFAASGAKASAVRSEVGPDSTVRLALLEDVDAIRRLNQAYARHVISGDHEALAALFVDRAASQAALFVDLAGDFEAGSELRSVSSEHFGEHDVIDVAPDGKSATARIHCAVELEAPIEPRCPLVDMAREQGGGVVRRSGRGVLENEYAKLDGGWKIRRCLYRSV